MCQSSWFNRVLIPLFIRLWLWEIILIPTLWKCLAVIWLETNTKGELLGLTKGIVNGNIINDSQIWSNLFEPQRSHCSLRLAEMLCQRFPNIILEPDFSFFTHFVVLLISVLQFHDLWVHRGSLIDDVYPTIWSPACDIFPLWGVAIVNFLLFCLAYQRSRFLAFADLCSRLWHSSILKESITQGYKKWQHSLNS